MDKSKPFGLILSKKVGKLDPIRKSVFDSSSDEEIAEKGKFPKVSFPASRSKARIKVESTEDPGIYEYDNIYDEMKASQVIEAKEKKKQDSRYIESLLKAASKRKKEHERRVEKKIHVEREKEGNKYKDKEEFVTSAYKKKMQEMEEEEKRESLENQMNEMMDVTKQKDLSGFYRHFLKQSVGEEKIPVFGDRQVIKQETDAELPMETLIKPNKVGFKQGKIENIDNSREKERHELVAKETEKNESQTTKCVMDIELVKSQYEELDADSSQSDNDSSEDEEIVTPNNGSENSKLQKKITAVKYNKPTELNKNDNLNKSDADSNLDSESSEHDIISLKLNRNEDKAGTSQKRKTDVKYNRQQQFTENDGLVKSYKYDCDADSNSGSESSEHEEMGPPKGNMSKKRKTDVEESQTVEDEETSEQKTKRITEEKIKKDIFAKRTVGIVFDQAQARYFERRAAQKTLS